MLTIDYEHCTGCEACVQRCPKRCISMVAGEFGFLYPEIDLDECVNCHICEKVCPIQRDNPAPFNQKAYAAVHKDKKILRNSTSGGAFSSLAIWTLNSGGVVYGARMNDFMVHHVRIDSIELLGQLRGSKYLQSSINTTFIQAEEDLKAGKVVLFSGTPCQIDGLIKFLGHEYEKLITVDIVCHGVGSQAYFDKFISYVKSEMPQLREAKFRSKRYSGWSVTSGEFIVEEKPGKRISKPFYNHKNYYYRYFLEGSIYRKSCYSCKYANLNRPGDFTLGDFWGVEKLRLPINTYYGCSLIIANTVKAEKLLKHLPDIELESVRIEDAVKDNEQLLHPSKLVDVRNERIIDYETKTGKEIAIKYKNKEKKQILKGTLKMAIPYSVKTIIRSLRK